MRVTTGSWLSDAEALSLVVRFSRSSRGRLTDRDRARFPGETLLDRVGRAVGQAGCLPRKELYHIWTQLIPQDITPKNRLLIGAPADVPAPL